MIKLVYFYSNLNLKTEFMIDIKGKTALITGSSRGVGQQIAIGLAQKRCNVILHGRTSESNKKTQEMLKNYKVKTYTVFGELSDENQVNALIDQVKALNVNIDILYNNAGIMKAIAKVIVVNNDAFDIFILLIIQVILQLFFILYSKFIGFSGWSIEIFKSSPNS